MRELESKYKDLNGFTADHHSIPCFGHVLNIAVSELLRKGLKVKVPTGDVNIYGLRSNVDAETNGQDINTVEMSVAATGILGNPVNKLRAGVLKILASVRLRDEFLMCCQVENIKPRLLCYDVATRWGSTLSMIERVLSMVKPYNRTCRVIDSRILETNRALFGDDESDSSNAVNGMYVLDDDEILYLQEVVRVLDPFQQATNWVSGEKYPTMSRSIVLYNTLIDHLEKKIVNSHVFSTGEGYGRPNTSIPSEVLQYKMDILQQRYENHVDSPGFENQTLIFKGCWLGRLKLIKYYIKTDDSKVYPIATFCDSSIKDRFWSASNWGEYADIAMDHVEDEWKAKFKPVVEEEEVASVNYAGNNDIFAQIAMELHEGAEYERDMNDDELEVYKREKPTKFEVRSSTSNAASSGSILIPVIVDENDASGSTASSDDVYLEFIPTNNGPSSTDNTNLSESFNNDDNYLNGTLDYWKRNKSRFPQLSRMAKKYLSVPSTSTACERCFSRSGRLVTASRSRLTPENVKKIMLVSYWIDMIDTDDLAQAEFFS